MGQSSSKLDKVLADSPDDERCYGLENFGNTCYCNSVLQALYFCKPFRERVLAYASALPKDGGEENLLSRLAELFVMVGGRNAYKQSTICNPGDRTVEGGGARRMVWSMNMACISACRSAADHLPVLHVMYQ